MTVSGGTILVEEAGGVHTITLNRPERRNALNPALIADLSNALHQAEECGCGVVVLTGAGPAFCSGMDLEHLKTLSEQQPEEQRADAERIMRLMRRLYTHRKTTIAAVNGAAIAGGAGLATLCDFTLAVPGAKFGYTEVRIGFLPAVVSVFLLEMVGEKRARDLLLSGRIFEAEEAHALGLVTEVVPEAGLAGRTRALAQTLLRNSPESMRAVKEMLSGFSSARLDHNLEQAMRWNERIRNRADFGEGLRAFLEKRPPVWPSQQG